MKNQKLYNELYQLREELRRTSPESSYKTSFGYYATKKQVICSYEELNEMAKKEREFDSNWFYWQYIYGKIFKWIFCYYLQI